MHRIDVARATGRDLVLTADHDGVLVGDIVAEWAARHGSPCTLTLTGPAGGRWSFGTGGPELELDAVEFCRIVSRRGGPEPVLVDTGLSPLGEQFRSALWNLVDPADLRWVVVSHDDRDHTGSLRTILDQAPQATVVTNFISMVKIGEDWPLPMDRLRLVNAGDRLGIGDDVLDVFRPPTYDSPGTLAFHALRRRICFSSDCLGAFLPDTVDLGASAEDLPAADYGAGVAVFASALSPWMHDIAPDRWRATLADLRRRDVGTLLSTHGLPVRDGLGPLLDMAAGLPAGAAFVSPGQEFVDRCCRCRGAPTELLWAFSSSHHAVHVSQGFDASP